VLNRRTNVLPGMPDNRVAPTDADADVKYRQGQTSTLRQRR
jgi:hypothetical protein